MSDFVKRNWIVFAAMAFLLVLAIALSVGPLSAVTVRLDFPPPAKEAAK